MKTIYIDSDFKCHIDDDGTMRAVEQEFFRDKCRTFVEGHRFVPEGSSWKRVDGMVFAGPMIAPWKDSRLLYAAQEQYEADLAEAAAAYQEGVNSV